MLLQLPDLFSESIVEVVGVVVAAIIVGVPKFTLIFGASSLHHPEGT